MNEQIQEFAEQAEIKFEATLQHPGIDTAVITRGDLEKFAELILADVFAVGLKARSEMMGDSVKRGAMKVIEDIKQHFGIEE